VRSKKVGRISFNRSRGVLPRDRRTQRGKRKEENREEREVRRKKKADIPYGDWRRSATTI